jgi:hypothetical protein
MLARLRTLEDLRSVTFLALLAGIVGGSASGGCDSDEFVASGLLHGCAVNSDCDDPLVCAFERCHEQCSMTRDCPEGQLCVRAGAVGVCQLPDEVTCKTQVDCRGDLVCTPQGRCLGACASSASCLADQSCVDAVCVQVPADAGTEHDAAGSGGGNADGAGAGGANDDAAETTDVSVPPIDGGGRPDVLSADAAPDTAVVAPSTILDDFNRADGVVNSGSITHWVEEDHGGFSMYEILSNQLVGKANAAAPLFWGPPFGGGGASTAAFVTIHSLDTGVTDFSLLLAAQTLSFCDFVRVFYEAPTAVIKVITCEGEMGTVHGDPVSVGLIAHRELGAVLEAPSGNVTVFLDKKAIAVRNVSGWKFLGNPGRIGIYLHREGTVPLGGTNAFDDFGGY